VNPWSLEPATQSVGKATGALIVVEVVEMIVCLLSVSVLVMVVVTLRVVDAERVIVVVERTVALLVGVEVIYYGCQRTASHRTGLSRYVP
jgi:hypothetical protein